MMASKLAGGGGSMGLTEGVETSGGRLNPSTFVDQLTDAGVNMAGPS
jgi:hypothetical protein